MNKLIVFVVIVAIVVGVGAYFMLKGPEGGEGAPQARAAVTFNTPASTTENSTVLSWLHK